MKTFFQKITFIYFLIYPFKTKSIFSLKIAAQLSWKRHFWEIISIDTHSSANLQLLVNLRKSSCFRDKTYLFPLKKFLSVLRNPFISVAFSANLLQYGEKNSRWESVRLGRTSDINWQTSGKKTSALRGWFSSYIINMTENKWHPQYIQFFHEKSLPSRA